jgi:hypothetical protein
LSFPQLGVTTNCPNSKRNVSYSDSPASSNIEVVEKTEKDTDLETILKFEQVKEKLATALNKLTPELINSVSK